MEIAEGEGMSWALTREMVEGVEEAEEVMRDEQEPGGDVRWWRNVLRGYVWDAD